MTTQDSDDAGEFVVGMQDPLASKGAVDEGEAGQHPGRPPVDLSDVAHGYVGDLHVVYLPVGGIVWNGWED